MEQTVDAVIIGGGPAGASCALYLQSAGISNLIVEKQSFPKDKLCAGLVTKKTYSQISKLIKTAVKTDVSDGVFCDTSKKIKLFYKNELLTDSDVSAGFRLVRRRDFDSYLIETYKNIGGTVLENRTCTKYDLDNNTLTLDNNDTVKYKYLIGADGALSPTRKALGYKAPRYIFCTETFVPVTDSFKDRAVNIYFGYLKKGYVWVFPHGDELCVGLGDEYCKGVLYEKILRDFLRENGLEKENCKIKGAFIPYGECVDQRKGYKNAVLIGDAGGFADQITGEGLYFALCTGEAAAEAVIKNADFKAEFLRLTAGYKSIVKNGAKTGNMFYKDPVMSAFHKKVKGRNGLVAYYCDNQISKYNYKYSDLSKLFADYKLKK